MKILVINGVNLNLTGKRETGVYGNLSLDEINDKITAYCVSNGDEVRFFQSNVEGEIVNALHGAYLGGDVDVIVLNAGAFTHYSYAIRDAISAISVPVLEVHMSNVHAREEFRKHSVLSPVCKGVTFGLGLGSYIGAIAGFKAQKENV